MINQEIDELRAEYEPICELIGTPFDVVYQAAAKANVTLIDHAIDGLRELHLRNGKTGSEFLHRIKHIDPAPHVTSIDIGLSFYDFIDELIAVTDEE